MFFFNLFLNILNMHIFSKSKTKKIINLYNNIIFKIFNNTNISYQLKELNDILSYSIKRSDINDHLITIFLESISIKPRLILELGVRGGDSTFVFERVASLFNSILISVDIMDCSSVSNYHNWYFINNDDIEFANNFSNWCKTNKINPCIDILFIDTSHLFDHTLQEIISYFPYLADHSKVILHDTNLMTYYMRRDHSIGVGWDNQRGVIKALEVFFGKNFNEKIDFIDFINPFLIKHHQICCGLTILEKFSF